VDWILRGKPWILREDWDADFGGFGGSFGLVVRFLGGCAGFLVGFGWVGVELLLVLGLVWR